MDSKKFEILMTAVNLGSFPKRLRSWATHSRG